MRDKLYRENLLEDPPATPDEVAAESAHRAIPIRVSDLADEFEARAIEARSEANETRLGTRAALLATSGALFEAAALARGAKPFAHVQPEVVAHQPVVIEMHSPASIGRMSDEDRRAHRAHVLDVIRSMRVQLDRLGDPDGKTRSAHGPSAADAEALELMDENRARLAEMENRGRLAKRAHERG